ncbi:AsmA family protein [Pedobacter changchengzhani]|uniref:AsmA family protein n=1 Tax=Pedobacter changchengzhani TaxID=2529274 RepID=A0A4R5MLZ2_9SPHI|nr:AsmA-like C-terminal region-containing protein [Pedobacter changchengzhani]TDG36750.1 AsmA family protein [Pedobacter changchengzhani]
MARWLKLSLKILLVFIGLIILIWVGGTLYINKNKERILASILSQINKNISGKITATNMEPTLLSGLPDISVSIKNVLLSDSLAIKHKHNLLQAGDINVSLDIASVISGNIRINKIVISNASVYLFTDSNGYSNTNIFKQKIKASDEKQTSSVALQIKKVDLKNVSLIIDNQQRHKLFSFDINEVNGRFNFPDSGWVGTLKLKTLVKSFAFNTDKGSFLKNSLIEGTLAFNYNKELNQINVAPKQLNIAGYPFTVGAKIKLAEKATAFAISIDIKNIFYKDISLLLSPNISSKLLKFNLAKPINIRGTIVDDGSGKYGDPLVKVSMAVRNNVVSIPDATLTDCNFDGYFTNRDTVGGIIGDENSTIKFYKLTAKYFNAPFKIDTLLVNNLSRPIATGLVTSDFQISDLNNSLGNENFTFKGGKAIVKLYCKADIDNFKFTKPDVSGRVQIVNADIMYLPRKLQLLNSSLDVNFNKNDLTISNGHIQIGKSVLNLNCEINNFLNLYYTNPEKILVNLQMHSPQLYLNEFLPLLAPRNRTDVKKTANSSKATMDQLSNVLALSKMNVNLKVERVIYNKFVAKNLMANISIKNEGIYFNKINVRNAGGTLNLTGNIQQEKNYNKYAIDSKISKVNVKDFFYSFDNFGQKTITNKNLQGNLSALAKINGIISPSGTILPRSINGKVIFNLNNAALLNFEPLVKIGRFAFSNRNLADVKINNLDGTLNIKGDKIIIDPVMRVNSSVLNFNIQGTYGINSGTDIAMDIPLRNPKKDVDLDKTDRKFIRMKGIVLHLKAVDDDKGGIKIRWNKDHD